MATSIQLFFLFVLLTMISAISSQGGSSSDFIANECWKNFTNNDILNDNINNAIADLLRQTSNHGFANSSHGVGDDNIYGVAECRRDISGQECSACIVSAAQHIRTACPNAAEARIWYQYCSLRYNTNTFFGQLDTYEIGTWYSTDNMTNPDMFKRTLNELSVELWIATSNEKGRRFGWGEIRNRNLKNNGEQIIIYGMVQCTWDLGDSACSQCLNIAFDARDANCGVGTGCYVIFRSCAVRYEISPFLFLSPGEAARSITFDSI